MALKKAQDLHLLTDIELVVKHRELRPVYRIKEKRSRSPDGESSVIDMSTLTGRDNLAQAVIIRLLTPLGELSTLGHPQFGSRLHEMIGRTNVETTRNLVRLRILEALNNEPRIADIIDIVVTPTQGSRSSIDIQLTVQPAQQTDTITIGPLTLELAT